MCGFVGVLLDQEVQFSNEHLEEIKLANQLIRHRGPDDDGSYHDDHIALAFRRLSIIDIDGGQQPFSFGKQRYWMVFNGEIYNYKIVKEQLKKKGYHFTTNSDTEVAAFLFLDQGVEGFSELRGMFAILIWDKDEKRLYGARDPFGIKPFYYCENEHDTVFSSEKKCISYLNKQDVVDQRAFQHYLSFQYVPDPLTITEGIQRLAPGHYFVKDWQKPIQISRYFHASLQPVHKNERQLMFAIREVLFDSVTAHMQSDVPVGAFLSGGIDSTIIVAMAKQINPQIKTFSVGFDEAGYSEIDVAKESAEKLGVENIHRYISAQAFVSELPKIIWHMDDPLADPASIPLYFVANEARKHVKVVLSGEGADELFGGYNIYREAEALRCFQYIPKGIMPLVKRIADMMPEGVRGKSFLQRGTTSLKDRYIGNAKMFEEAEKQQFMLNYASNQSYQSWTKSLYKCVEAADPVQKMQYIDIHTWLSGDILVKADRMTMANSLELRVPFLDKAVFDVAKQIPTQYKIADGTTKSILRKAVHDIIPAHVLNRKKLGFPVPMKSWLRDELYEWAKNLIKTSETDHLVDKSFMLNLLELHAANKGEHARKLWTVLVFMLWHQIFVENRDEFSELRRQETGVKSS